MVKVKDGSSRRCGMASLLRVLLKDILGGLLLITIGKGALALEDEELSPTAVGAGIGWALLYSYGRERDPLASALSSRPRKFVFNALHNGFIQTVLRRRSSAERHSGVMGFGIGIVLYRILFGLLKDVPSARFEE